MSDIFNRIFSRTRSLSSRYARNVISFFLFMREILQFALISGYFEDRALLRKKKKKEKARPYFEFVRSFELLRELATSVLTNENCFDWQRRKRKLCILLNQVLSALSENSIIFLLSFRDRKKIEQFKIRYFILFIVLSFQKFKCYGSVIDIDLSLFIVNCYNSKEWKRKWKIAFLFRNSQE